MPSGGNKWVLIRADHPKNQSKNLGAQSILVRAGRNLKQGETLITNIKPHFQEGGPGPSSGREPHHLRTLEECFWGGLCSFSHIDTLHSRRALV
jgi:hypothetical protein